MLNIIMFTMLWTWYQERDWNISRTCVFIFSIIVFSMMKLLVILSIMELISEINIFKYVRQKHGQSAFTNVSFWNENQTFRKTCVFIFHHSIQHDEASGYTIYNFLSKLSQATAQKLNQFYLDVMFWTTQVNNIVHRFIGCLFVRIIGLIRFIESILVNNLFCKIILPKCIGVLINYLSLIFWLSYNYHQTKKVYKYHAIKKIFLSAYKYLHLHLSIIFTFFLSAC